MKKAATCSTSGRSTSIATATRFCCGRSGGRGRLPRGLPELLFPPGHARGTESRGPTGVRSGRSLREEMRRCINDHDERSQTRNPCRQSARGHGGVVSPRRLQNHFQRAKLLSEHRRRRNRVPVDPCAGDGPLCGRRRAGRRTDRLRLDCRDRGRRARGGRVGVLESQPPAGPLGALRAGGLAGQKRQGSARQADCHRGRGVDHALPGHGTA